MKKFLLLSALCVASFNLSAQTSKAKTTSEEYNYMTKGYRIQQESGLDMKKGYSTMKPIVIDEGGYVFTYIGLIRGETKDAPFVGWIVKAVSNAWGNVYWYSIPQDDSSLLSDAFSFISVLDEAMTTAFFVSYAKINQTTRVEF